MPVGGGERRDADTDDRQRRRQCEEPPQSPTAEFPMWALASDGRSDGMCSVTRVQGKNAETSSSAATPATTSPSQWGPCR
ncbi:hypothetical protein GCM10023191_008720 [Actinoallomurus oryzae]|uniref:Uncharacterized protein n=1 Tax=Actinoallomurus oryzae TaxID=502180 RepID=A0ABP8PEG3_9ACTN